MIRSYASYSIFISGVEVIPANNMHVETGTLQISSAIGQRSAAGFIVIDYTTSQNWIQGQLVQIYDDLSTLIFTGYMQTPTKKIIDKTGFIEHTIQCMDAVYLADKRLATNTFLGTTAGNIVRMLWYQYLMAESVLIAGYMATVLTDVPTVFWPLNELSGTVVYDLLRKTDSTYHGTPTLGNSAGLAGDTTLNTASFNGSSQYAECNTPIAGNDFSIEFRIKTTDTSSGTTFSGGKAIVNGETAGVVNDYGTALGNGGHLYFGVGNPDQTFASSAVINDGTWHHCVCTRVKSTGALKIYVDGTLSGSGTATNTGTLNGAPKIDIARTPTNFGYLNASISCVALYDFALSSTQVTDHYNAQATMQSVQDGSFIISTVINLAMISDVIKTLAEKSTYWWNIDETKTIYFLANGILTAPFSLDMTQVELNSSDLTNATPLYRNREYVTNIHATTVTQTETRKGDGNTKSFAMGFALNSVPTITVNGTPKTVGIAGVDTGKDWYWSQSSNIITEDSGAGALTSSDTLIVVYIGEYIAITQSDDLAQQATRAALEGGTTGIVEYADPAPTAISTNDGFQYGSAFLAKYSVEGRELNFTILDSGLAPGQLLTVTIPQYNLTAEQFLIESVNLYDRVPIMGYKVKALQGPFNTSWVQFYQKIGNPNPQIDNVSVGTSALTTILANLTDTFTWTMSVTATKNTCPICGPATICGPSTIIC